MPALSFLALMNKCISESLCLTQTYRYPHTHTRIHTHAHTFNIFYWKNFPTPLTQKCLLELLLYFTSLFALTLNLLFPLTSHLPSSSSLRASNLTARPPWEYLTVASQLPGKCLTVWLVSKWPWFIPLGYNGAHTPRLWSKFFPAFLWITSTLFNPLVGFHKIVFPQSLNSLSPHFHSHWNKQTSF